MWAFEIPEGVRDLELQSLHVICEIIETHLPEDARKRALDYLGSRYYPRPSEEGPQDGKRKD